MEEGPKMTSTDEVKEEMKAQAKDEVMKEVEV